MFDFTDQIKNYSFVDQNPAEFDDVQSQAVSCLLRNSSIELSTNGEAAIRGASEILPPGMPVYVPKMPRETLADKLVQIGLLRKYGLNPIPHIVARQLSSEQELCDFLGMATSQGGIHRVLVIGGDDPNAVGPYQDSASVLASGLLQDNGIDAVDVAGYPDGHPQISSEILLADLKSKSALARSQGFSLNVVTQFSFQPGNIVAYCADLALTVPDVPVYAGLVGPTSPAKLLRFAKICGVGTSMRAANKLGANALKLAMHASPDKQFEILARHKEMEETGNLKGIHLFSFGGFVDSSTWLDGKARDSGVRS